MLPVLSSTYISQKEKGHQVNVATFDKLMVEDKKLNCSFFHSLWEKNKVEKLNLHSEIKKTINYLINIMIWIQNFSALLSIYLGSHYNVERYKIYKIYYPRTIESLLMCSIQLLTK